LAIGVQEVLTAIGRVCGPTAERHRRGDVPQSHQAAHHTRRTSRARRSGFASEDVKLAIYAIVVFLDESILNSPLPVLAGLVAANRSGRVVREHMVGKSSMIISAN